MTETYIDQSARILRNGWSAGRGTDEAGEIRACELALADGRAGRDITEKDRRSYSNELQGPNPPGMPTDDGGESPESFHASSAPGETAPFTQTHIHPASPDGIAGTEELPSLFVKPGCPWCNEAAAFMDEHGIPCRRVDVTCDSAGRSRMEMVSGQDRVPTLDWHGDILADFGLDELVPFLRSKNVNLEDS